MKTIKVQDWAGKDIELTQREYIKRFTDDISSLYYLVNYEDSSSEFKDGTEYYVESKSEEQYNLIVETVTDMARNEFNRLHEKQAQKVA